MREIKFRAITTKNGFVEDNPVIGFNKGETRIKIGGVAHCDERKYFILENNEIELYQYTGLKDKNGKEIYEGDIVKFYPNGNGRGRKQKGIVEYSERRVAFMFRINKGLKVAMHENMPTSICITDPDTNLEVIGNIHENKDLLK